MLDQLYLGQHVQFCFQLCNNWHNNDFLEILATVLIGALILTGLKSCHDLIDAPWDKDDPDRKGAQN